MSPQGSSISAAGLAMVDFASTADVANTAQRASPTYRLAALDEDFLLGASMRGVRFQLEFAKADELLAAAHIRSTLVVFGSSRVTENAPGRHGEWYAAARAFAAIASKEGGALTPPPGERLNVIATGGGPGVMEAANRGAADVGAPSIGFGISLPHEQEPNPYSTPELSFCFHYFAMRKMHLAMRASALVVFPGGFGTLDELFELLTLRQTGKCAPVPILMFDRSYWTSIINFEALVRARMISQEDLQLMTFAEAPDEAWDLLRRQVVVRAQPATAGAQAG